MTYLKEGINEFHARMNHQRRTDHDQDDLSDLYDEGKAIWVSGVGFVPKRRRINIGGSDGL